MILFGYALSLTPLYVPLIYLCECYLAHYNKCSVIRTAERAALTHNTFASKKEIVYVYNIYTLPVKSLERPTFFHAKCQFSDQIFKYSYSVDFDKTLQIGAALF